MESGRSVRAILQGKMERQSKALSMENHHDVVVIGAGLAGLSLARQLLLNTDNAPPVIACCPSDLQLVSNSGEDIAREYKET